MGTIITNLATVVDEAVTTNVNVIAAQQAVSDAENSAISASSSASDAQQAVSDASDQVTLAEAQVTLAGEQVELAENQVSLAEDQVAIAAGHASSAEAQSLIAEDYANQANQYKADTYSYKQDALLYLSATNIKYDEFDDRYLGVKEVDPSVDNDGQAIQEGALYWNSTIKGMKVYNGSVWAEVAAASGALLLSNNLADLVDVTDARDNLDVDSTGEVSYKIATAVDALGTNVIVDDMSGRDSLTGLTVGDTVHVKDSGDGKWANYVTTAVTDGSGATSTLEEITNQDVLLNASSASAVKVAYESNSDTNAYTDAERAKLSGIEAGATADQTAAEIEVLYESRSNTNKFTDDDKSKVENLPEDTIAELAEHSAAIDVNAANTSANLQAIINLATAQAEVESTGSLSLTTSEQQLTFVTATPSSDTDIIEIGTNTITLKKNASFNFRTDMVLGFSTSQGRTITVRGRDADTDDLIYERSISVEENSGDVDIISSNKLLTVGKNGIPAEPITLKFTIQCSGSGITLNSFDTNVASSASYDLTEVSRFTELSDTPSTLVGSGNKVVRVTSDGTALEFYDIDEITEW